MQIELNVSLLYTQFLIDFVPRVCVCVCVWVCFFESSMMDT